MALVFPTNPTIGQQFTAQNGVTYTWDGTKWSVAGGGGGGGGGPITPPIILQSSIADGNAYVELLAANGTLAAPAALQAGNPIGGLYGGGYNGAAMSDGSQLAIDFYADGNWTPSSNPTRMVFGTTEVNATHATPRLTIGADGIMNFTEAGIITSAGSSGNSYMQFMASQGTLAAPSALTAGTPIGGVFGGGYDGFSWSDGGEIAIDFYADGNWTSTSHPTRIEYGVTPSGAIHAAPSMRIDSTQTVTIEHNLTVDGIFTNPSDSRLKTDVAPYQRGLAEVLRLEPVQFRPLKDPTRIRCGLMADDVEGVMPEFVTHSGSEKYKMLDVGSLPFVLINAVKQLAAEVDELKLAVRT